MDCAAPAVASAATVRIVFTRIAWQRPGGHSAAAHTRNRQAHHHSVLCSSRGCSHSSDRNAGGVACEPWWCGERVRRSGPWLVEHRVELSEWHSTADPCERAGGGQLTCCAQ